MMLGEVWRRYGGTDIEATKHVTCLAYVHNTVHIHNIHEIYKYIYTLRTAIKRIKRCEQALKHPKPTETKLPVVGTVFPKYSAFQWHNAGSTWAIHGALL